MHVCKYVSKNTLTCTPSWAPPNQFIATHLSIPSTQIFQHPKYIPKMASKLTFDPKWATYICKFVFYYDLCFQRKDHY